MQAFTDSLILCFGRFQPPTKGHREQFSEMFRLSREFEIPFKIGISTTVDKNKNPLSVEQRKHYISEFMGRISVDDIASFKNPFEMLKHYSDSGVKSVILIAGSDRVDKYQKEFERYIKHPDPKKSLNFDYFSVYLSGERTNTSGSNARSAIKMNSYSQFITQVPDERCPFNTISDLWNDLREIMVEGTNE